jgi:hypothetical protein
LAARSPRSAGQVYNVVSDVRLTQAEYLRLLSEHGPHKVSYVYFPWTLAALAGAAARLAGRWSSIAAKVGRLLGPGYLRSCARRTDYSSAKIQAELGWKPDPDHESHFKSPGRYGDPQA